MVLTQRLKPQRSALLRSDCVLAGSLMYQLRRWWAFNSRLCLQSLMSQVYSDVDTMARRWAK